MVSLADRALLLRRHRFGESSLVAHVLTERHGRVALLAKGAFRPKSAFSGVLDLFDTLEIRWTPGSRSELAGLREARPLELRRALSRDLDRYRAALSALELADLVARPGLAEEGLFRALVSALDRMAGKARPEIAFLAFELRFLAALGLAPALRRCATCSADPETTSDGRATFSAGAGGRLCRRCAGDARASGRRVGSLPQEVMRIAAALADADDELIGAYRLAPPKLARVRDFVDRFLEYHLETRPRTWRTLRGSGARRTERRSKQR